MTTTTTTAAADIRWVHGTTTHDYEGRVFIARDAEGFNLFRCPRPWKAGTLVGTFGSLADAKRGALRYI